MSLLPGSHLRVSSKGTWVSGSLYLALASSRWYISSSPSTCCTEFLLKLRDAFYEELFQGLKPVQNMMFIIAIPV